MIPSQIHICLGLEARENMLATSIPNPNNIVYAGSATDILSNEIRTFENGAKSCVPYTVKQSRIGWVTMVQKKKLYHNVSEISGSRSYGSFVFFQERIMKYIPITTIGIPVIMPPKEPISV